MLKKETSLSIFPTDLWFWDIDDIHRQNIETTVLSRLSNLIETARTSKSFENVQSSTDIHTDSAFSDLSTIIYLSTRLAVAKMKVQVGDLVITGCWANVSPPGKGHQAHYHSNNLLSGVYYVTAPEGADKIVFRDPRGASQIIAPHLKSDASAPPRAVSLNVIPGRIVVFPSWLEHLVPINRSDDLRISIAFNVINEDFVRASSPPQWSGIPIREESD